jgi:hypothetical protein
MHNVLHTFTSSFTFCACGARSRNCAFNRMDAPVHVPAPSYPDPREPVLRGWNSSHYSDESGDIREAPGILVSPASPKGWSDKGKAKAYDSWRTEEEGTWYTISCLVCTHTFSDVYRHPEQRAVPVPIPQRHTSSHHIHKAIISDSRSISPASPYPPDPGERYRDKGQLQMRKVWRNRDSDSTSPSESGTPSERSQSHPMEIDDGRQLLF